MLFGLSVYVKTGNKCVKFCIKIPQWHIFSGDYFLPYPVVRVQAHSASWAARRSRVSEFGVCSGVVVTGLWWSQCVVAVVWCWPVPAADRCAFSHTGISSSSRHKACPLHARHRPTFRAYDSLRRQLLAYSVQVSRIRITVPAYQIRSR